MEKTPNPIPKANDNLEIDSNVPASDSELIGNSPFCFKAGMLDCIIKPLTLKDYLYLEKTTHDSIYLTAFWRAKFDADLATLFKMDKATVKRAKNLAKITSRLLEPLPFKSIVRAIINHNKHYKTQPRRWILSLKGYFEAHLPMEDLKQILSYLARYSAEKKTELLQMLQQGLGSLTQVKEENESSTSSGYIEPDF